MKPSKSNTRYAIALAPIFLAAIPSPTIAQDNQHWQTSESWYWLKSGGPHPVPAISEFTPKTAPHYTCVLVLSSGAVSCFPKVSSFPKDASGLKLQK